MSLYSINVNFACKTCRAKFRYVDQFIEHKKEKHAHEFQDVEEITFEEGNAFFSVNQHKRGNLVEPNPHHDNGNGSHDFENSNKKIKLEHYSPNSADPPRPFVCQEDNCGSAFVKQSGLNFHMKTRHTTDGTDGKKFSCEVCEKMFYTKNDLKRHVVAHSEEKPFKCDYPGCTSAYKLKPKLSKHQRAFHKE